MHALDPRFHRQGDQLWPGQRWRELIRQRALLRSKVLTLSYDPAKARAMLDEDGAEEEAGHAPPFQLPDDPGRRRGADPRRVYNAPGGVGSGGWTSNCSRRTGPALSGISTWTTIPMAIWRSGHRHVALLRFVEHPAGRAPVNIRATAAKWTSCSQSLDRHRFAGGAGHYSRLQEILTRDVAMLWVFERDPMLYYRRVHDRSAGPTQLTDRPHLAER